MNAPLEPASDFDGPPDFCREGCYWACEHRDGGTWHGRADFGRDPRMQPGYIFPDTSSQAALRPVVDHHRDELDQYVYRVNPRTPRGWPRNV